MKAICTRCQKIARVAKQLKFDDYEFLLCTKCSDQYDSFLADLRVTPCEVQLDLLERFMKSELVIRYQDSESVAYQEVHDEERLRSSKEFFSLGW